MGSEQAQTYLAERAREFEGQRGVDRLSASVGSQAGSEGIRDNLIGSRLNLGRAYHRERGRMSVPTSLSEFRESDGVNSSNSRRR